jgi:TRAP-type C4-dicarboxylate transport system permease small subunit
MTVIAAILLGIMMLFDVADVCGRYFFLKPVPGTQEVIGLLLICVGTWGMARAETRSAHISISVLTDRLPPRIQAIVNVFDYLLALSLFFLMSWQMFSRGVREALTEMGGKSEILGIPFSPFFMMFGIGVGMLCIALLLRLIHSLAEVMRC